MLINNLYLLHTHTHTHFFLSLSLSLSLSLKHITVRNICHNYFLHKGIKRKNARKTQAIKNWKERKLKKDSHIYVMSVNLQKEKNFFYISKCIVSGISKSKKIYLDYI